MVFHIRYGTGTRYRTFVVSNLVLNAINFVLFFASKIRQSNVKIYVENSNTNNFYQMIIVHELFVQQNVILITVQVRYLVLVLFKIVGNNCSLSLRALKLR